MGTFALKTRPGDRTAPQAARRRPKTKRKPRTQLDAAREPASLSEGALQAKLEISKPEDELEREADEMADRVMRSTEMGSELQPKLEVSEPEDELEREADEMADRVMRMPVLEDGVAVEPHRADGTRLLRSVDPALQREAEAKEEEEEEQQELADDAEALQRACETCGDDEEESEPPESGAVPVQRAWLEQPQREDGLFGAPRVLQRACAKCRAEEEEDGSSRANLIQRACASCAASQAEEEERVQRAAGGDPAELDRVGADFEDELRVARAAGGEGLPPRLRAFFEPRFHADFGDVRLHTDQRANTLARSVHARAFTIGNDLFFRSGAYQPQAPQGVKLIAHELTHVLQQRGGEPVSIRRALGTVTDRDAFEGTERGEPPAAEEEESEEEAKTKPGSATPETRATAPEELETRTNGVSAAQGRPDSGTSSSLELERLSPERVKRTPPRFDEEVPEPTREEEERGPPIEGEVRPRTELRFLEGPITEHATSPVAEEIAKLPSAGDAIDAAVGPKHAGAAPPAELSPDEIPEASALTAAEEQNEEQAAQAEEEAADPIAKAEEGRALAVGAYQGSSAALEVSAGHLLELAATRAEFARGEGREARAAAARASDVASRFLADSVNDFGAVLDRARVVMPERLSAASQAATLAIAAQTTAERAAISLRAEEARKRARVAAGGARATVDAHKRKTVEAIRQATQAALDTLTTAKEDAETAIGKSEQDQVERIETSYRNADRLYRNVGSEVADEAERVGSVLISVYSVGSNAPEDSLLDGYLTRNRARARMKAAREVTDAYKAELKKAADEQADQAAKGQAKDEDAVGATGAKGRETLASQMAALEAELKAEEARAIENAETTADGMRASIQRALEATLDTIDRREQSELQTAADTGYLQVIAAEQIAHSVAASLQQGVIQAIGSLEAAVAALLETFAAAPAPPVEDLRAMLESARASAQSGLAALTAQIDQTVMGTETQLAQHGERTAEVFAMLREQAGEQTEQLLAGFSESMELAAGGAVSAFAAQKQGYQKSTKQIANDGAAGLEQVGDDVEEEFKAQTERRDQGFEAAAQSLKEGLRTPHLDNMRTVIKTKADEAAAQVQPRWKGVLKWVLIIAVIVVVALVVGPAVIGFVGAAAASALGAGAAATVIGTVVGGAIVGAAAGGTIQVISNAIDNRPLTEGLGKAVAMGALGGALGAGAGALVGKFVTGPVLNFAANVVADGALELATELVTGEFSWENFGLALAMSIATGGLGEVRGVKGVQGRFHAKGADFAGGLGIEPRVDVAAPTAPPAVAPPKVDVDTKAPRPEPGVEPRPTEPRAPAPDAIRPPEVKAEPGPTTKPLDTPRLDAEPDVPANQRTNAELAEATTPFRLDGEDHVVGVRQIGGEAKVFVCSTICKPLTDRIDDLLPKVPKDSPLRAELGRLKLKIQKIEADFNAGNIDSRQVAARAKTIVEEMNGLAKRHPAFAGDLNVKEPLDVPQGFTEAKFAKFKKAARQLARAAGLPEGDFAVHGSRARGEARPRSDIDVILRVDEKAFFEFARKRIASVRPGTKLRVALLRAARKGKLSKFDISPEFNLMLREILLPHSPFDVDFSIIVKGSAFDQGPFMPLGRF